MRRPRVALKQGDDMKAKAIPAMLSGLAITTVAGALLWQLVILALLANKMTEVLAALACLL